MKKIEENYIGGVSGMRSGSLQTPQSKRNLTRARTVDDEEDDQYLDDELEEEQVHPDDKIGNMMLKKMGIPSYFKSNKKKQTVSQKKVNEMNTHPDDKIAQMMLNRLGIPQYFETKGGETHQKNIEKIKKKYVSDGYANTKTDAYGDTKGNYRAKIVSKD